MLKALAYCGETFLLSMALWVLAAAGVYALRMAFGGHLALRPRWQWFPWIFVAVLTENVVGTEMWGPEHIFIYKLVAYLLPVSIVLLTLAAVLRVMRRGI